MTIDEARAKAHQQYDDCMFCPGCSKLLTGIHMGSRCYTNWIERKAQQILENTGGSEEPIIIGNGIGIVCLRNKLK